MNGIKTIDAIQESGPLVHLDKNHLPDLDDLMIDVLVWQGGQNRFDEWDTDAGDFPTQIFDSYYYREASVGWYRKNPCACGDEHKFDMDSVAFDDDFVPQGPAARGAFVGVYFG